MQQKARMVLLKDLDYLVNQVLSVAQNTNPETRDVTLAKVRVRALRNIKEGTLARPRPYVAIKEKDLVKVEARQLVKAEAKAMIRLLVRGIKRLKVRDAVSSKKVADLRKPVKPKAMVIKAVLLKVAEARLNVVNSYPL